jgi:hypothetical protein
VSAPRRSRLRAHPADRAIPGYVIGSDDEAAFREEAPKMGLSAQHIETLIRWHRTYYT